MPRLRTTLFVAGAAVALAATTGGSAAASETAVSEITPALYTSYTSTVDFQDDLDTGCGSHRSNVTLP